MAIGDSFFDVGSYNPQGSLIERLLAGMQQQSQYQPGASFDNPRAGNRYGDLTPQATPIAVGNYQMPRMGNPDLYQPQQVNTPPNAMPAQGELPKQTSQEAAAGILPPQLQATGTGLGDRLIAGAQNFAHAGGLIPAVVGGITGLATGERLDPQGMQAQLLNSQFRALVQSGLSPQQALLAVTNPEFAKAIIPAQFGADQYQVSQTGEDALGRKTYQIFNKRTGELQPIANAGGTEGSALGDPTKSGAAYLATLPPETARTVQAMVEGRLAPPSSFALKTPYWSKMLDAAQTYDPTFDATKWSGRIAGVKDFSAGKSAEMVRSANQTLHHVGQLLDSMDALHNSGNYYWNKAGNAINETMYGTGEQGAFRTNAHAVAEELSKVFKGSNLSDSEIRSWESNLNENMSPTQQRAQIAKLRDLLQGSLEALSEKRETAIGPIAAAKQGPLIKEAGQQVLDRIQRWLDRPTNQSTTKSGVSWSVE